MNSMETELPLRDRLYQVVFESDTPAGRAFDVSLLWCIILSVLAVLLESVGSVRQAWGGALRGLEWGFTGLFTAEYFLRLYSARHPGRYARSFFGLVDLGALLPTYISILFPGAQSLLALRALRLVRVFRILKLGRYTGEAQILLDALAASREKITVFLSAVVTIVLSVGALMYFVEGEKHGFANIPTGMYWAVVTMTTVGYGDLVPQTALGKFLASLLMIAGYGILAVPTGIVTVELAQASRARGAAGLVCRACHLADHDRDARHCKICGALLAKQA
jgi:voltage-gated potassium channel